MADEQQRNKNDLFGATKDSSSLAKPAPKLKNQLSDSSSPYLRAHKDNLVAWQEWSSETIALAQAHERPIFLSVGYSACHWCHVMAHESFESPEIATVLNESFVPVKVDRESRPDLDDTYMNFVTATTGSGGWPLNVFLTPDLQPLFGGTYWPSPGSERARSQTIDSSEERPMNFLDIVQKMRDIWQNERQRCLASAADITHQLQAFAAEGVHGNNTVQIKGNNTENDPPEPLDLDLLDDALEHFASRFDTQYGGFVSGAGANAPKFATPANLTFLLRIGASITRPSTHTRFGFPNPVPGILGKKSCASAARMALHTLQAMSRSAMRDHIGNGFHRYSVTPDWNLPHFEKMLYDNAQLLGVYCDAWALGRDPEVLGTIYDLTEYLTKPESPIVRKGGGWYSSEDADSNPSLVTTSGAHQEKKEGAFYIWTLKELQSLLGDHEGSVLARHFGAKEHGNIPRQLDANDEFINQNVLHVDTTPSVLAKEFGLKEDEVVRIIKEGKKKLLEFRNSNRAAPDVDDKVILSYNALAISALARAANTLASIDQNRARVARDAAVNGAAFIKANMFDLETSKLTRIYSDHLPKTSNMNRGLAFVDDYAFLIHAARTLFDLTFEQHYLEWALQLQSTLDRDFSAGRNGGYYQAAVTRLTTQTGIVSPTTSLTNMSETTTSKEPHRIPEQILNLKPGTDNTLPSANGVIAGNLLYLASYTSAQSSMTIPPSSSPESNTTAIPTPDTLLSSARNTINAFAPEIIQHPFLYVSLLSAMVMDTVGVKSLLVPTDMDEPELESRGLRGFNRTVVRAPGLKTDEVVICEKTGAGGVCRPLRDGDLEGEDEDEEEGDGGNGGGAQLEPVVSAEVIERREEMARKESLALELQAKEAGKPVVNDVPPA